MLPTALLVMLVPGRAHAAEPEVAPNSAHDARPYVYGSIGVGFPELLHVELGGFPHPRVGVEARLGFVLGNVEAGLAVEGAAWAQHDDGRGQAVTVTVDARVNPTLGELRLASGPGEVLGAYVGLYGGWRWIAPVGFLARVQGGPIVYEDGGFAVGANVLTGVGWAL